MVIFIDYFILVFLAHLNTIKFEFVGTFVLPGSKARMGGGSRKKSGSVGVVWSAWNSSSMNPETSIAASAIAAAWPKTDESQTSLAIALQMRMQTY
jgi:hypothetical protein